MVKKSFISLLIFCLISLVGPSVFAANGMESSESTLNRIRSSVQNMASSTSNAGCIVKNTSVDVVDKTRNGVSNITSELRSGASTVRNATMNVTNSAMNSASTTSDYSYTPIRTSTVNVLPNNDMGTVWIILGVTTVAIVALVWYYGTQSKRQL